MTGRSRSLKGQGGVHRKGGRRKPWVTEGGGLGRMRWAPGRPLRAGQFRRNRRRGSEH